MNETTQENRRDEPSAARGYRVKARADIEITVEFEDDLLDYGSVQQAVQDTLGYTGVVVHDVTEYEEVPGV